MTARTLIALYWNIQSQKIFLLPAHAKLNLNGMMVLELVLLQKLILHQQLP